MHKVNHGVLIWGLKSYIGMLNKCKDYIAYGEIDESTLLRLVRTRGKIEGNKPTYEDEETIVTDSSDGIPGARPAQGPATIG